MNIDQSRQDQAVPPLDYLVRKTIVASTDKRDRAVCERDIDMAAIMVLCSRLVPGGHPLGISDDGCRHGALFVPLFTNEIMSG